MQLDMDDVTQNAQNKEKLLPDSLENYSSIHANEISKVALSL